MEKKTLRMGHLNYLQYIDQMHIKTHASGPMIKISALNSSIVLNETNEEEILLQTQIVLKYFFSRGHYRQSVLHIVNLEMLEEILFGIRHYQTSLYRRVSFERMFSFICYYCSWCCAM